MNIHAKAALFLAVVALTFAASAASRSASLANLTRTPRVADPIVYDRILTRLRAGEEYYAVIGGELRAHRYATREVFNWRTPLLWRSLALVPPAVRRGGLIVVSLVAAILTTVTAWRVSGLAALATGSAALGVVLIASAPATVAMGEAWAGAFVGISVCAYAAGRRPAAVAAAMLAMFLRELVAPYVLVCTALALGHRRWREFAAWMAAAATYGVYYGLHVWRIWSHQLPADLPGQRSWLAWGGLPFLLSTVEWNGVLLLAPWAAVAAALALIVAGVVANGTPAHVRVGAGVYLVLFLAVGQPFDRYWGLLVWPTWALACGYGAAAIVAATRTVVRAARAPGTSAPAD